MLEEKEKKQKKIGFWAKIGESVEALSKPAQPVKVLVDRFLIPGRGPVERCKKHAISSSSISFLVEGFAFPVEVRSKVTVSCQALNALTVSDPINPNSTG